MSIAGAASHASARAIGVRLESTDPLSKPAAGMVAARTSGKADAATAVSRPKPAASMSGPGAIAESSGTGNMPAAARETNGTAIRPTPRPQIVAIPATNASWRA